MKLYVMTTDGGRWATNGLTFDSEVAAMAYGRDLFSRWFLVTDFCVVAGDSTEMLTDDELEARGVIWRYQTAREEVK